MKACRARLTSILGTLSLWLTSAWSQLDGTRLAGGSGSALVEAVLAELHDTCIYPEDALFLRRIAYAETKDGTDPATYTTPGYDGGIWKVDQAMFQRTQTERSRLTQQYNLIRNKLGIDWSRVTWTDMRKPLYSALAAAMILTLEGATGNIPVTDDAQAAYWMTHYRKGQGSLTEQNFKDSVKTLKKTCARTEKMDVLFLLDASVTGSGSQQDWTAVKDFVVNVIVNMALHNGLGPNKDRVSLVTFSNTARLDFDFNVGSDLKTTVGRVSQASQQQGATNISAALQAAHNTVFTNSRPNAAKVIVLVTGGRDPDQMGVVLNLMPLKLQGVTLFTVGAGPAVGVDQLKQMASQPSCSHAALVNSFGDLKQLSVAVERISCRVPIVLSAGQYTYPCGFNVLAQISGGSVGTSVTVSADHGAVEVFGSYTTQLPNVDLHDLTYTASAATPAIIFTRDPRPLTLSLQSDSYHGLMCSGNYTVRVDNQAARRTECNKKKPDLVFLVDSTLAHTDAQWTAILNFVRTFSTQFEVTSRSAHVALVSFSDTQTTHFGLGQFGSTGDLLQALRGVARPLGQVSNLPAALTFVRDQLFSAAGSRRDSAKTLILVTPGSPADALNAVGQAASLHMIGTRVICVAVGNTFDDVNLNAMASGPQHVQKMPDVSSLTSVVGNVIKEACGNVSVVCVEGGIQRQCHVEDLVNMQQSGNMLGPDRTVRPNPCAMQLAAGSLHLDRFPHPTDSDKFLLCDSSGQAYIVLCPPAELYNPIKHQCLNPTGLPLPTHIALPVSTNAQPGVPTTSGGAVTTQTFTWRPPLIVTTPSYPVITPGVTPSQTLPVLNSNPCTPGALISGQLFQAVPGDPFHYYHCTSTPYVGAKLPCSGGKVWTQSITQCVYSGVIVDQTTHRIDPSIPNPCITGGAGYYPNPKDSNSYIQCDMAYQAFLMHCRPHLNWVGNACG